MTVTGWLRVEPRHLTALLAVRNEGSFRAAATRLGLVQSAVSQRIAQLEQCVGLTLVERSRGQSNPRLTDAGAALLEHAEEILAEFDAALADLRTLTSGGQLRVGAYESVASVLVPPAITRLARDAPHVRVSLHEEVEWERFFARVSSGELDAAFADMPVQPGPFAFRELMVDPCVLVVRADSPLARRREPPTLTEVSALPLIAGSWPMLRLITEHMRAAGAEPRFVFQSETNSGVQALVAHGLGAALMPRLAVNESDSRIAVVSMDGSLPARRIALYWHRDRHQRDAIMRFLAALEACCANLHGVPAAVPSSPLPSVA